MHKPSKRQTAAAPTNGSPPTIVAIGARQPLVPQDAARGAASRRPQPRRVRNVHEAPWSNHNPRTGVFAPSAGARNLSASGATRKVDHMTARKARHRANANTRVGHTLCPTPYKASSNPAMAMTRMRCAKSAAILPHLQPLGRAGDATHGQLAFAPPADLLVDATVLEVRRNRWPCAPPQPLAVASLRTPTNTVDGERHNPKALAKPSDAT